METKSFFKTVALSVFALSIMATSCTKSNESEITDSKVELRLASGVEGQTVQMRSAFTSTDTQIPSGQTVAVWVDEVGASQIYGNNVMTANGSGGFTGGTAMFFPQSGANVDIYAIHTNATLANTYPGAITHNVASNQKALTNYAPSDLLYAKSAGVTKSTPTVQLTFYHLLSKLQVAIVPGSGLTASNITGVTVGGMKLTAGFTLNKATAPNSVAITSSGTATNIEIGADLSTNFTSPQYNDAIIVPQTLAASTAFITVHLASNSDLTYVLPAAVTFDPGKKYQYHITASLTGLTITSTISNWAPINPVVGTAGM